MNSFKCAKCQESFNREEILINSGSEVWHAECWACSQCFRPFKENEEYYEFEGRKYCEHDFNMLFAPKCQKCKQFIKGKVIKALSTTYHPDCFNCGLCETNLSDQGFIKNGNLAVCHACNTSIKTGTCGKAICLECSNLVDEIELLRFKDRSYHAYHFNCNKCGIELTRDARERNGVLLCLRCNDKMGLPICAACHGPIENERVVTALNKQWHNDHFACSKCEKAFNGSRYYEKKGLAYCEIHYHSLFGNICFVCNKTIIGDNVKALNKHWCKEHFACSFCDGKLKEKDKFYDVDLKPCCRKCFDKFPSELRKRLKSYYNNKEKNVATKFDIV